MKRFVEQLVDHIVRSHREPEAEDGIVSVSASLFAGEDSPDSTVHDRWLAALRAEQAALRGKDNELEDLAEQIREWRKPLDATIGAPFRLCFRLEEPAPPREGAARASAPYGKRNGKARMREAMRPGQRRWYVRYLLQGTDDPLAARADRRRLDPARPQGRRARSGRAATCTRRCCSRSRRPPACARRSR